MNARARSLAIREIAEQAACVARLLEGLIVFAEQLPPNHPALRCRLALSWTGSALCQCLRCNIERLERYESRLMGIQWPSGDKTSPRRIEPPTWEKVLAMREKYEQPV